MTDTWQTGYMLAVADFVKRRGMFVELVHYPRSDWTVDEEDPDDYDAYGVTFGWCDYEHTGGRPWRNPPEVGCQVTEIDIDTMRERTLLMFQDTFTGSRNEVGVEFRATCACGKYTNKWLRWEGSLGEILPELLRG